MLHVNKRTISSFRRQYSSSCDMSCRRVVITGLGLTSPIGNSVQVAWRNLLASVCGIKKLSGPEYESIPCKIAAYIDQPKDLNLEDHLSKSEMKPMSPATCLAVIAAKEALQMSKWDKVDSEDELNRTGVAVGVGMVDLQDIYETKAQLDRGYNRVSPFFIPRILPNLAGGQISIKYGFRGPNHSVSTACATGAHSIGDAYRFIKSNYADVMVCGATEAAINPLAVAGFCRLRALSTNFNDSPEESSRPFDSRRDGFVMGEGSAIFVLEEMEHALKRSVPILGEILGYGVSGDASHITSPRSDGLGACLAMKSALTDAGLSPEDIGYVNAHATSTPIGDAIEASAIKTVFGPENIKSLFVSSTKGAHGHLLGSAGNLEALFTVLACKEGLIPPTLNYQSSDLNLNIVSKEPAKWSNDRKRRVALKNAFGFGGTNACLAIGEFVQ